MTYIFAPFMLLLLFKGKCLYCFYSKQGRSHDFSKARHFPNPTYPLRSQSITRGLFTPLCENQNARVPKTLFVVLKNYLKETSGATRLEAIVLFQLLPISFLFNLLKLIFIIYFRYARAYLRTGSLVPEMVAFTEAYSDHRPEKIKHLPISYRRQTLFLRSGCE